MLNNKDIPAPYYKRAAELMSALPNVEFYDIVEVLYESDKFIAKEAKRISAQLDNEDLPTGLKWENPVHTVEKDKRSTNGRRSRKAYKEAVIDGKDYTATTLHSLFIQLGIQDQYKNRQHENPFINVSIVEIEGAFLKNILEQYGSKLESYSAYDYDGQFKTIDCSAKNMEESANA